MQSVAISPQDLQDQARRLGFDLLGVAPPTPPPEAVRAYREWIAAGYYGEMAYMARPDRVARREDPSLILPGVRAIVCVAVNYYPGPSPEALPGGPRGRISRYAWGQDYHAWMLPRLEELAAFIRERTGGTAHHRAYVDTGPILERALAAQAGLGFIGKNTCLIHPWFGSWLFLGEILVDVDLPLTGPPMPPRCGSCTRCLEACPTGALVAPYVLDARRCISYLTIEYRGEFPADLRSRMGNWVYGCDICQEVCPWQRFARPTAVPEFRAPSPDHAAPMLADLLALDDAAFQEHFRGTPIARIGRERLQRNARAVPKDGSARPSGVISAVHPHSLAARLGLRPGDELLEINGRPARDIIDVQFYGAQEHLTLRVRREGTERVLRARRRYDEPLGLEFTRPTFDTDIRRCHNRCDFCFVSQMPHGLRPSLYIKDDDYRHSFLFGNYITLTNLTEEDWERIGEQHLSPLYVSVQATDPDLRRRILGNLRAPDVMDQLHRLAQMGIEVHTQLVLVPGLNDGPHLDRSIGDLAGLYPAVRSVSVVPVGLTKYHRGGCRPYTTEEMRRVWEQVTAWQRRLQGRLGVRFVYLTDEWYLRLGEKIPPRAAYDGLDLQENGVGLVRSLLDRWRSVERSLSALGGPGQTWVTGELMAPVLEGLATKFADRTGIRAEVVPVPNRFFGETVTVAGLLTGRDIIAYLQERSLLETIVLPAAMFRGPEGQSLDEMWPEDLSRALNRPVFLVD